MRERTIQPPDDAQASWVSVAPERVKTSHVAKVISIEAETAPPRPALPIEPHRVDPAAPSYLPHRQLAQGGMGEVWEAEQTALDRIVALKRIRDDRVRESKAETLAQLKAEFEQEAMAAAALEHPNIVPVYDYGRDAVGMPQIAMKLVKGTSWADQIGADWDKLSPNDFLGKHLPILVGMAQAVAYAHAQGIIHRDLKPGQVMVGAFGEVLLMDWGIAIRAGREESRFAGASIDAVEMLPGRERRQRTIIPTPENAPNPAGTPALMAPEQTLPHARDIGFHTDVFLLGSTLYLLLTGHYPFHRASGALSFKLAQACQLVPPEERTPNRDMPPDLVWLCLRAMARDPKDRVSSAREFIAEIQAHITGASRRKQSSELTSDARTELGKARGDYNATSDVIAKLNEAHRLWPDNPLIAPLRADTTASLASSAIDRGDLAFARIQGESLPSSEQRDRLLARVRDAEQLRERRARLLRIAAATIVALSVVLAGGSVFFAQTLNQKNAALTAQTQRAEDQTRRAERQLAVAMRQYGGAADLVSFMLEDMRKSLDLRIERDQNVAAAVGDGVALYLLGIKTDDFESELALIHANTLRNVAGAFASLGLFDSARKLAESSLALYARLGREDSAGAIHTLEKLAMILTNSGRIVEAEVFIDRALEALERHPEDEPLLLSELLARKGRAQQARGDVAAGLVSTRRSFDLVRRHAGAGSVTYAESAENLAELLIESRQFDEADALLSDSLKILLAEHGEDSAEYASAIVTLASLRRAQEVQPEEILPFLEHAHRIMLRAMGPDHPNSLVIQNNLATVYSSMNRHEESLELYRDSLESFLRILGPNHPEVAATYNNIGNELTMLERDVEALEYFNQSIEIILNAGTPNAPMLALFYTNVATCYAKLDMYDLAYEAAKESYAIRSRAFGDEHRLTIISRWNIIMLYIKWARFEDIALGTGKSVHWAEALELMGGDPTFDQLEGAMAVRAEALARTGRPDEAREIIARIFTMPWWRDPGDVEYAQFRVIAKELGVEPPPKPKEEKSGFARFFDAVTSGSAGE